MQKNGFGLFQCPHVGQMVKVMWDMHSVEVYSGNTLICSHDRSFEKCGYSTKAEHMPEAHQAWKRTREMNAASIVQRAAFIGPSVKWVTETLLTKAQFPQQSYGKCQAVLALVKTYGRERVENACHLMMTETSTASLRILCNILKNKRDLVQKNVAQAPVSNDDVRGASAYSEVNNGEEDKA